MDPDTPTCAGVPAHEPSGCPDGAPHDTVPDPPAPPETGLRAAAVPRMGTDTAQLRPRGRTLRPARIPRMVAAAVGHGTSHPQTPNTSGDGSPGASDAAACTDTAPEEQASVEGRGGGSVPRSPRGRGGGSRKFGTAVDVTGTTVRARRAPSQARELRSCPPGTTGAFRGTGEVTRSDFRYQIEEFQACSPRSWPPRELSLGVQVPGGPYTKIRIPKSGPFSVAKGRVPNFCANSKFELTAAGRRRGPCCRLE